MVGVAGLLAFTEFAMDNERATEIAGGNDGGSGGCDGPAACKFVALVPALNVGGGGSFTAPASPAFAFAGAFAFPPMAPGVGGAEGTEAVEDADADAGINALLSVLLAAAFSIALFSRSL